MLAIDEMDRFHEVFGIDPRRFTEMPRSTLEEIIDALDGYIDATDDAYDREILCAGQRYALVLLDALPADETGSGKPVVQLSGTDGNVFVIIAKVKLALADADWERGTTTATDFVNRAFAAESYDEVLRLAMEFVDVR